jgi:hypothetical protein
MQATTPSPRGTQPRDNPPSLSLSAGPSFPAAPYSPIATTTSFTNGGVDVGSINNNGKELSKKEAKKQAAEAKKREKEEKKRLKKEAKEKEKEAKRAEKERRKTVGSAGRRGSAISVCISYPPPQSLQGHLLPPLLFFF